MSVWSTRAEGYSGCIDETELRNALSVLVEPDQTFEIRALPSARSRIFKGASVDDAMRFVEECSDNKGIYWTLNPLQPNQAGYASDKDVVNRRWFLVDIDPNRKDPDASSTDDEKEACLPVVNGVIDHLAGLGWQHPILIDSGNGFHLLYRIDLPNDALSRQILKDVLSELGRRFDTEHAVVDRKVHNASRISKLPGTWARKGKNSTDRPHRVSKLLWRPEKVETIGLDKLKAVTKPTPEGASGIDAWIIRANNGEGLKKYVDVAIERECCRIMAATPGGAEGRNNTLNDATFRLATMADWPEMNAASAKDSLRHSAIRSGLSAHETDRTILSGWTAGSASPRQRPEPTAKKPAQPITAKPISGSLVIKASDVVPKKVDWLWTNRVAIGFITLFAGRTGLGKSFVTCDLAARLTTGRPLADEEISSRPPMSVLMISEDPYEYVLAPRLKELEADMDRVSFFTWEAMATYSLGDLEMLDTAYQQSGCPTLIVIDPPTNFLGGTDEHKNAEVRQVLMGLVAWLNSKSAACILITHVNKQTGKGIEAVDRIMGSVAWASTSRVALAFSPDPNTPDQCLFSGVKNNLGQKADSLAYQIVKTDTLAKIEWKGTVDISADDAMNQVQKKTRGQSAVEWLEERFRENREWRSEELKSFAQEHGLSKNALFMSPEVKALPIRKKQHFTADGEHYWTWSALDGWPPEISEMIRESGKVGKCKPKSFAAKENNTFPGREENGKVEHIPTFPHSHIPNSGEEQESDLVKRARRSIVGMLMGGAISRDKILVAAMEMGIPLEALNRAAESMGVEKSIEGTNEMWRLP